MNIYLQEMENLSKSILGRKQFDFSLYFPKLFLFFKFLYLQSVSNLQYIHSKNLFMLAKTQNYGYRIIVELVVRQLTITCNL